jgi:hypothetical protein
MVFINELPGWVLAIIVPDLLIDLLGWHSPRDGRLRHCRISIEHISAGDLVAMAARDPAQRGETCGERECWLILGVVTSSACQRARVGRAARGQSDRRIEQTRILGSGEPLAFGARRAGYQVTQDLFRCLWGYFLAMARKVARFVVP